ncbi:MAG TPA: hypothetical protein VH764_07075 [Gemmatimonadales bacterium]
MTASLLDGVNWEVVTVFAVLVLLEGLRRVPAGALVVRGTGPAGWRPTGVPEPRQRWRLISWWSPIAPALVLVPLDGRRPTPAAADLDARLKVATQAAPWLTVSAGIAILALIAGLPLASARFGAGGFLVGAAVVLILAITNAVAGAAILRRIGAPRRRGQMLAWCSPFAAGRVLETVYEAALAGASQAQAVRALAGDGVFAVWFRPRAYDALYGGVDDPDLLAAADAATLRAIVAAPPPDDQAGSFCPRCAARWVLSEGECPACAVPLTRLSP